MERRSFLTYFGVSWAAACFPLVLSACNSSTDKKTSASSSSSPAASTGTETKETANAPSEVKAMTVADLDKNGSVGNGKVIVTRDPADKTKLLAVYPACTHEGCLVEWKAAEKSYVCPCHGAKYAADGKVKGAGPAKSPLKTVSAKIAGDKIVVTT
jgi:cytochrome b6-f complex iron-sulfur subunit